jgi:hypothetical protein
MTIRRDASKTIWKTVVFAGAMLGSAGCHKTKAAPTTPPATVTDPKAADPAATPTDPAATPTADTPADPCASADPCGDRARGTSDEGSTGRGFILS